jgi:hypothetical protein
VLESRCTDGGFLNKGTRHPSFVQPVPGAGFDSDHVGIDSAARRCDGPSVTRGYGVQHGLTTRAGWLKP